MAANQDPIGSIFETGQGGDPAQSGGRGTGSSGGLPIGPVINLVGSLFGGGGGGGGGPFGIGAGQWAQLFGQQGQQNSAIPPGLSGLLGGGNDPLSNQAYETLLSILQGQGRTDPMRMNQQLTAIGRGTEANQVGARESLAMQGPGALNSGLGQALMAAIGQGGVSRQAEAIAQENALQEQRMRQDLDLFARLVLAPLVEQRALNASLDIADQQRDDALFSGLFDLGANVVENWGFWR